MRTPAGAANSQLATPFILRRLAALLYDTLLVLPLIMTSVALVMGVRSLLGLGAAEDGTVQLNAHLVQLVALLTGVTFFSLFWLKSGQTLGMQAWRIKLVGFDGGQPRPLQIFIRCLGAPVSAGCLGLGYLWCVADRNGRYWHDYLSSTELVLLPSAKQQKQSNTSSGDAPAS